MSDEITAMDCTEAFAVPGENHLLDMVHPVTRRSMIYGHTLDEMRARYPGAEVVEYDTWIAAKVERQRSPIAWAECTKDRYWQMLEVLPPADMLSGGFLVGEPSDHDAGNGRPSFAAFREWGSKFFEASRPLTIAEFRAEIRRLT